MLPVLGMFRNAANNLFSTLACRVCRVSSFGNTEPKTLSTKFGGSPHWACATWHVALPAHALGFALQSRIVTIVIITRFCCLEARCICRQATVEAAEILHLVGLARFKQDPIDRGHGAQYLYRPPPAGPTPGSMI
jgi:hypothetical protein